MKVMISQPMKGYTEEFIKESRERIAKELESKGYEVVDTIFADEAPKNTHKAIYYLAKTIEAMSKVDAVVFMKGWENARGCKIEYEVAKNYGKFIMLL